MIRLIARILWILPAALLLLAANQAKVAADLKSTWDNGAEATARVTSFEFSNRADVTYGYVSLRVPLEGGRVLERERMSLPHSLLPRLAGRQEVAVRVRENAAQEIVIDDLMPAHWLIAASQVGISLLGAALFFAGVLWWNRFLARYGDPAATARCRG